MQRRAFKQTAYAVRDEHLALDIVQDAMLKLAEKYGARPVEEFPMLFQRILQNTTRDFWRRQKVRNMWTTLLSSFGGDGDDAEDSDPLEILTSDQHDHTDEPDARLQQQQTMTLIEAALQKLPARQREAFLMRYWEDMDVAETAAAMGCSQGSVKTHCSRAVHALAKILGEHGLSDVMKKKGVEDEA
ncbi:MAG: RNA polymerase sigma factor [Methylophilaceae bacterium]|nr:RNA polymerase sigma factor [Methylophilaceae bacterium]